MKCKKGYGKLGNICVSNKSKKRLGKIADEFFVLKLALVSAITSIGGWAIFKAIVGIFHLEGINNWLLLVVGIIIILATYKIGWKKYVK